MSTAFPPPPLRGPVLVTGANGHLGREWIRSVGDPAAVRAVVRSERSADVLRALPEACRPEIRLLDPGDVEALREAARGCSAWVHLIGILKETTRARYEDAHEGSVRVVAEAAARAGVERIVYPSILGSHPDAPNRCLASKGRAEAALLCGKVPATVLRLPMVLGPGEIAAGALRAQASAPVTPLVRGGASLEQPIDTRDVVEAIHRSLADAPPGHLTLDLAGPESLSHRALVLRVAERLGTRPRIVPVPRAVAAAFAALAERLSDDPPVTTAMLGVLEHDDDVDPFPACRRLGLTLTPLDETLDHTFAIPSQEAQP